MAKMIEKTTFAGGCFWCMKPAFDKLEGVTDVSSGYMGGTGINPTYKDYAQKGHVEVVQLIFDPQKITYEELLKVFWRNIDPTDAYGQFIDRGPEYRSVIFYHNETQRRAAEKSKTELQCSGKFKKQIVTEITKAGDLYPAEEYHQNYHKTHAFQYKIYRANSGRDEFISKNWQDQTKNGEQKVAAAYLKKKLTPLQYNVTQENGTEPAFNNEYWDNHQDGIYVDVVSGQPLFSSRDKFDSGTGWPCFSQPLEESNIRLKEDNSLFMTRTEVKNAMTNSHLGHLFEDSLEPSGLRYCINSAALRFIPMLDLEKEGYGKYVDQFKKNTNSSKKASK